MFQQTKKAPDSQSQKQNNTEQKRVIKNDIGQSQDTPLDTPRQAAIKFIIEKLTGESLDPPRRPGKDTIVTEDKYRALSSTSKDVVVSVAQEKIIKEFLGKNTGHSDAAKIPKDELNKILKLINQKETYHIAEYSNSESLNPKYRMQSLTLVDPGTGENIYIFNGGPTNSFDVSRNLSFVAFKGEEKMILNIILGNNTQENSTSTILEDAQVKFLKAIEKEKYDKIELTFENNSGKPEALTLLFIKGTTIFTGIESDKDKPDKSPLQEKRALPPRLKSETGRDPNFPGPTGRTSK